MTPPPPFEPLRALYTRDTPDCTAIVLGAGQHTLALLLYDGGGIGRSHAVWKLRGRLLAVVAAAQC